MTKGVNSTLRFTNTLIDFDKNILKATIKNIRDLNNQWFKFLLLK